MQLHHSQNSQMALCFMICLVGKSQVVMAIITLLLLVRMIQPIRNIIKNKAVFTGCLTCSIVVDIVRHRQNIVLSAIIIPIIAFISYRSSVDLQHSKSSFREKWCPPLFLFLTSLLSNQSNQLNSTIHLCIFLGLCFIFRAKKFVVSRMTVLAVEILLLYQLILVYLKEMGWNVWPVMLIQNNHEKITISVIFMAVLVADQLDIEWRNILPQVVEDTAQTDMIEMKQLNQPLIEQRQPEDKPEPQKPPQVSQLTQQSQSYNLILLYPFFLYQQSLLQAPLYVYILWLQHRTPPTILRYLMYAGCCCLYISRHLHHQHVQMLSLSIILILDWRVDVQEWLTNFKALWLRWCFVVVLAVLFWFGLREVNLYHLTLMVVLLLFITRSNETGGRSFRNRNWKYLLWMFDGFVIVRYLYSITLREQPQEVLQLFGVRYNYSPSPPWNFNSVPMLMLILIVLQYWTYRSSIYREKSPQVKEMLLQRLTFLKNLAYIFQLAYYKSILWMSTLLIMVILLSQDFAISSGIVLLWILVIFAIQLCQVRTIILNKMWLYLTRMLAVQIIVRYFFEFTKFQRVHNILVHLPTFQFLLKYQKLLGLSIDYPSTVYFHTITKFQLTITLDLIMIFLAFLAQQYLSIIMKCQANRESRDQEDEKAREIYNNFILFTIVRLKSFDRIRDFLTFLAATFINILYFLIGLWALWNMTFSSLLFLIICLLYYKRWNSQQHSLIIQNGILQKAKEMFSKWLQQPSIDISSTKENNRETEYLIASIKIHIHKQMRKFIGLALVFNLFLTYGAQLFQRPEVNDFLSNQAIVKWQWIMYVYGTSKIRVDSYFQAVIPYLILAVLLIIDLKCCKFHHNMTNQLFPAINREMMPSSVRNTEDGIEPQLPSIVNEMIFMTMLQADMLNEEVKHVKQIKSETSMKVSIRLAICKVIERALVMILLMCSTIKVKPFSIPYVIAAFLLNSYGPSCLLNIGKGISTLLLLQYLTALMDFSNVRLYGEKYRDLSLEHNPLKFLNLSPQWEDFLSFNHDIQQLFILLLSLTLIASFQIYYSYILQTAKNILELLQNKKTILSVHFHKIMKSFYRFIIVMNPFYITLLTIGLELLDTNAINMVFCGISLLFLMRQYLADELPDCDRTITFWKTYFRFTQSAIIILMVSEYLMNTPGYRLGCTYLCSENNKIVRVILVFVFQIGVDLLKSNEYHYNMGRFYENGQKRSKLARVIISQRENDLRLNEKFKALLKRTATHERLEKVLNFLKRLKEGQRQSFHQRELLEPYKTGFLNSIIDFLPKLIDPMILKSTEEIEMELHRKNQRFIIENNIQNIDKLTERYEIAFIKGTNVEDIINQIMDFKKDDEVSSPIKAEPRVSEIIPLEESDSMKMLIDRQIRETVVMAIADAGIEDEHEKSVFAEQVSHRQQRKFIYYLLLETVISNWQHVTFFLMIMEFLMHCGLLMTYYPAAVFLFGLVRQFSAGRFFWRISFGWTCGILLLKYLLAIGVLTIKEEALSVLFGDQNMSLTIEFLIILAILCQTFILHTLGLFKQPVAEVESMQVALIRNLINTDLNTEELLTMLRSAPQECYGYFQTVFCKWQLKTGYDYSTFTTTISLLCLIYSFLCYDRMFTQISTANIIKYNQFTGGMVIWMLIQLLVMLLDRFIILLNLDDYNRKWDLSLVLKFILQILTLVILHYMMVWLIPRRSATHHINNFGLTFYCLYCLYFFISALQIRDGIDRLSRGFMERYVWYNGYVYTAFRVTPFLFEFKVFSDWFVTKTTMRLFDWIKFQDLFGRLFVAKCNSLFLRGKLMGSKIEWWKKALMGLPLLLCIILLIFGPLVLFSSLNPLATPNELIGGSVYLTLKINKKNEYPLFINSHISSIRAPTEQQFNRPNIADILENYNIQRQNVQVTTLSSFSDTYWEISEGSERQLLDQSELSVWQLLLTTKFIRKQTAATPIFTLNTVRLPTQQISDFKQTLAGRSHFNIPQFYNSYIRLDNNNGLHVLEQEKQSITIFAEKAKKSDSKYWVIQGGLKFLIVSDKYSQAIFGYSVVGFYISIILVVANYFRFIFQGGANLIALTDIPFADPLLVICQSIYLSRLEKRLDTEDELYWLLIDLVRSPDTMKMLTGNYLQARLETIKNKEN